MPKLDDWAKDIAPSNELRKWIDHDPEKIDEFKKRYEIELGDQIDKLDVRTKKSTEKRITLLYGTKGQKHNQAVVLKEVL